MEIQIMGATYIVNETYGMGDKDNRENIIEEKLAGIIIMDKLQVSDKMKTA